MTHAPYVADLLAKLEADQTPPGITARRLLRLAETEGSGYTVAEAEARFRELHPGSLVWSAVQAEHDAEGLEGAARAEFRRQKARQLASMRLASETASVPRVLTLDDLLAAPLQWVVEGLLPEGGSGFIVGKRNLGKTFATIDIALSVALGRPWCDKATYQGNVMFVLGEGLAGFRDRLAAWCEYNEVPMAALASRLRIVDNVNLGSGVALDVLKQTAEDFKPSLIVLDTFPSVSGLIDENEAGLAGLALQRAASIRREAAILLTGHPTKSTESSSCPVLRGSGALAGAVDLMLTIAPDNDSLILSSEMSRGGKNRNAATETMGGFYLRRQGASMVFARSNEHRMSEDEQALFAFFMDGMTARQFTEAAGRVYSDTTRKWAERLFGRNGIEVATARRGNQAATYRRRALRVAA